MKNKIITKTLIFFSLVLILFPLLIFAATSTCPEGSYQFETGVPFFAGQGDCVAPTNLQNMIVSLIHKLFPIAGVLGFAMIVWAGFEYATSGGDTNRQKDAQDRIANAIIGILLLFGFWLIINIINPDILKTQVPTINSITLPSVSTPFSSKPITKDLSYFEQIAKSYATQNKIPWDSDYSKLPTTNANLNTYFAALRQYNVTDPKTDPTHGASCDMYIAAIVRATIDPNYPPTWVPTQYNYLKSNGNFTCNNFTSLNQLQTGDILFKEDLSHTALKLYDGYYQASNNIYFPYGPSSSWYSPGIYCRYIQFSGGGSGGGAG